MSDAPPRWKDRSEFTIEEEVAFQQAERRGESFRVETEAYREARRQALADAGIEPEDPKLEQKPLEEMTPADHLERIRRHG
jgi:hypothetical protein